MKQEQHTEFCGEIHEELPPGRPRRINMDNKNGFCGMDYDGANWIKIVQDPGPQSRPTFQTGSNTFVEKSSCNLVFVGFFHFSFTFSTISLTT
jgi:hypothetical protein